MKISTCAASAAAMLLIAHSALADCDDAAVKWLEMHHYSPAEAMRWCNDSNAQPQGRPAPSPKSAQAQPQPQPQAQPQPQPQAQPQPQPPSQSQPQGPSPQQVTSSAPASTNNEVQNSTGGGSALSTFKTSGSNGSSLATAHIATSYTPINQGHKGCFIGTPANDWCKMLGFDISASLPIQSATLPQYAKQAVLTLDGGVVNIYSAFTGGRNTKIGPYANLDADNTNTNPRVGSYDHIYFSAKADPLQGLVYLKQGIGVRGVKTALQGTGMAGLGTAYLGLGYDGPLLAGANKATLDAHTGWMVVEAYGTGNAINHHTMETLFGAATSRSGFFSMAGRVKIGLPGKFFLSAEYAKAFGTYGKAHIGDTSIISFGYNNEDTPPPPAKSNP